HRKYERQRLLQLVDVDTPAIDEMKSRADCQIGDQLRRQYLAAPCVSGELYRHAARQSCWGPTRFDLADMRPLRARHADLLRRLAQRRRAA
ncbi:hypothetical protein, partial [Mesorhizobium sp. M00.F.Ca.ET.217.01.1.1]|uniref:hypothetical protein n=1 Tax=Mesorhizobium sp. M00.F.Ca.ET.217.01.1.1 TaxID=2500529 RepID=UPI00167C114A